MSVRTNYFGKTEINVKRCRLETYKGINRDFSKGRQCNCVDSYNLLLAISKAASQRKKSHDALQVSLQVLANKESQNKQSCNINIGTAERDGWINIELDFYMQKTIPGITNTLVKKIQLILKKITKNLV